MKNRLIIHMKYGSFIAATLFSVCVLTGAAAQTPTTLTPRQKAITEIAMLTAKSNLTELDSMLDSALDSVLTLNEAKEVIVHTYAYCGFPKALRGLQTLVGVIAGREQAGRPIVRGREASPVTDSRSKYERGRQILSEISGIPVDAPKAAYAELSPEVDVFLKEHLFCDLFERDVLTYVERELATVAVIASLGDGVEPMLRSHSALAKRLGATDAQIEEIVTNARRSNR